MPVSLEQRLLLRQLGIDPSFSNDQFHGGLYGQPDAMSSGGVPMMQQETRDWRALGGGGFNPVPTRMSQPVVGGPIGPDTNDISQQAKAAQYQQSLDALQALDRGARPIIEGTMTPGTGLTDGSTVPSRSRQILDQLTAMPNVPESTRQQMAFAGLNTGTYDRMMDGQKPLYTDQQRADLETQRKISQGNRAADLATRQKAVQDRARRKGEARDMRMGDGGTIMADKYMQMVQSLGPQGGGGAGPSPEALVALYGPQLGPQLAEHYRLSAKDQADAMRGSRVVDIQDRQTKLAEAEAAAMARDQMLSPYSIELRKKPGFIEQVTTGGTSDDSVAKAFALKKNMGLGRDAIVQELISDGYPADQVNRIVDQLAPVATQPSLWDAFFGPSQYGEQSMSPQVPSKRGVYPMSMGQ